VLELGHAGVKETRKVRASSLVCSMTELVSKSFRATVAGAASSWAVSRYR
jgi:hypothetical protein